MNSTINNKEINKTNGKSDSSLNRPTPIRATSGQGSDWKTDIAQQAESLDQRIRSFLQARPVTTTLIAVGIGLVGSIVLNKIQSAKKAA